MKVLVVIMREYKDRGIIKWAPFDALISYQDVLKTMRYERDKQDKPMLSDDQYEMLNRMVTEAMLTHKEISVTYYEDGYFKTVYGTIKTYAQLNKTLLFHEGFCIEIDRITDVTY